MPFSIPRQIELLTTIKLQLSGARVVVELTRQHTHSHEITAVNPLKTCAITA
jgi:hypothetical protein